MRRIRIAVAGLLVVLVAGTAGYMVLGFTLLEAMYQTITTVSTVGFREVRPLAAAGQVFTMALIVFGVGTVLYNLGVVAEAVTEGHLRQQQERRRMDKKIELLRDHIVVCGHGRVGRAAANHLLSIGCAVVVVDRGPDRLVDLDPRLLHLVGDVTHDEVLLKAGLDRARAAVIALDTDADTVYVTLAARSMVPGLVIIARARHASSKEKMVLAGATRAVNPQAIGGRRMAVFALQPEVGEFLDVVMHDENLDFRLEDVLVEPGSELAGRTLADLSLRQRTGVLVLALRRDGSTEFEPGPPDDVPLPDGCLLIALGTQAQLDDLAALGAAA